MYEDLTVENVKNDIISRLSTGIDTREGSFANDMIGAVAYKIWQCYQSLGAVVPVAYVDETSGEYIDRRCAEYGITRKPGTRAAAEMTFAGTDGTVIPASKVFLSADGLEFTTDETVTISGGTASVFVTAADVGEQYNVAGGAITGQIVGLTGLSSFTNGAASGGTDEETDAALVARLYDYLQIPATSGNAAHYRQWALGVDGVGDAKVTPLWDGAGTVRVLIVGSDRGPVDSAIVSNCAASIGENRPIGADVTVLSAEGLLVDVSAEVTIDGTTTLSTVQSAFEAALHAYLQGIAFEKYELVYNRIAYMLLDIDGVVDYTSLTINGGTSNVAIGDDQVPVMGTVVIC